MNYTKALKIEPGNAICYSGYREGQRPGVAYPDYDQVKEDLLILKDHWKYIRLYDCGPHSETVLKVIEEERLDLKVMLGAYIEAEMNNFGCPWGGTYPDEVLQENKKVNLNKIDKLIGFANKYSDIIFSLSVGNEACVDWTDHYVPVESVIKYVRLVKAGAKQPVTFCENYVPWLHKLEPLVAEIDFISIHTYPVWEYQNILNALEYTKSNYYSVAHKYPDKPVVITEAGWATNSNGRGIDQENVNEDLQDIYYNELVEWSKQDNILTFVFEAFDEPWKGSPDPNEPEKHWGLFKVDRTPKLVMQKILEKNHQNN
ncbi:glycoside hydrolase family 17 protein [Salinimicrobium gaetbulicola]|uniref:Endo-1,3-beta-glucanase btgC n=1 Tax=Salinimicrobium gaetbulicola TaxID=999702 RepID=A0ABW3IIK9_9FLAO